MVYDIKEYIWICIDFYKICSKGRKAEEMRSQRLSAELAQFRHEAEKRLAEKDEEIEAIR